MFAVRIVDADFYVTKPTAELDVLYSKFRDANTTRVPVIRIFGSTPGGQKTCLHIHQVFPYIFVPYDGTQPREKYLKQFATSIDFAVQVALGKATSGTNHVFNTEIVKRIPFYGYHEGEQEFIKIQFYNPRMVAKVVDLLQNGAILNKIFQPYESHIPYLLQFFIDFNLYGMNLVHARKVHFRGFSEIEKSPGSPCVSSFSRNDSSSFNASATSSQNWNKHTIPSDSCLGPHVAKTSRCELEVDVIAEDILNQLEIGTSIGRNPGIAAMWADEKQRRCDHGQSSQIAIPVSQDRGEMKLFPSETEFKKKIHEIIQERNQIIQSQLEIMEKSLSPEEFQELSQSILLDGKEPCSQTIISQDIDENIPVVDESAIEVSQSVPNSLSGHIDEELVAILLSLAEDPNDSQPQECSPKASQRIEKTESDNEDEESMIMSQPVWNDDDPIKGCESASQSTDDEEEEEWKQQRIPQYDGPADDDAKLPSNRSTSPLTRKRKKIVTNIETKSDDEDDFRIKKKSKITSQRKAFIAQLNVVGGKTKHRKRDAIPGRETIESEATKNTKCYHPPPGSEITNWNDGNFPNLELFHQSSKPRKTDKGRLGTSEAGERRKDKITVSEKTRESSKNNTISTRAGISKPKKDKLLLHLETESSGSQTSDFELRLSDSSTDTDDEDFECMKNVSKITAVSTKIESFYVAKQAPEEVNSMLSRQVESNTYPRKSSIISKNRKSSSGNQTRTSRKFKTCSSSNFNKQGCILEAPSTLPLKTGEIFGTHSEKDAENSGDTGESRKQKKTVMCLMFTNAKRDKKNEEKIHKNCEKTEEVKSEYTSSRNCEKSQKEDKASVSRRTGEDGKLSGKRILLDACVKLERVSVKELKSRNSKTNVFDNSSQNVKETVDLAKTNDSNSPDFVVNEELDSLYQMAMLSPRSDRDDQESPPFPSSPSLNLVDQDLDTSLFLVQEDNDVNKNGLEKQLSSLVSSNSSIADMKDKLQTFDKNVATGTSLSLKMSTEPFPIIFVKEEDVKCFRFSPDEGGTSMDMREHEVEIYEDVSTVSPEISVVCESSGSSNERCTSMDMREHEVEIREDVSTVSPEISVVRESSGSSNERCTSMDMREHEVEIREDVSTVSPEISVIYESSGNSNEGGTGVDMREHEVEICRDNILSPKISVVCESGDMLEDKVGVSRDENAMSLGLSAVCDSFSSVKEQASLDIEEMLKDIENPCVLERQESFGEMNINSHVESCSASELQVLPSETYSKSLPVCEENDQSHRNFERKIWKPAIEAPLPSYILKTRRLYGLPHKRHQKAFCSDSKDIPSAARIVGGRRLLVPSLTVDELAEFDLGGNFQTLREFRGQAAKNMDNSLLRDCLGSLDKQSGDDGYVDIPRELQLALMEDRQAIITPATLPPSPKDVQEWMKIRKTGNQLSQGPEVVGKKKDFPDEGQPSNTSLDENSGKSHKDSSPVSGKTTDDIHSPRSTDPVLDFREMLQPVSHEILIGPQHSTPVSNPGMKSEKLCQYTPIEDDDMKSENQEVKMSEKKTFSKMKNLKRNILNSQVKERCHLPSPSEASYIEGPTPTNSFGFKISQPNIQDAKSVRQIQFLTLLSLELHVRTRKSLCPDPEFDAICAMFYHIENETAQGKQYETGIIVVRNESTKLRNYDSSSVQATANASTSLESTHPGISRKTTYEDSLIRTAGISSELNIITEHQETDAINRFIKLVHEWDPDIFLGFEVQMLSWGYLIQRASALGIDLTPQLSRILDSSGTAQFDAEKDQWGASKTSEISISGRIMLNVWRLMRHEVTLNVYSFENISYHVLHQRIPLYTYRQLTRWWDQKLPHNRWRTVDHYVTRCQGNIKILNHVDFINRTSEFARLFGILFYSVISRGSQFRVESMMLRLAKPMNYLAVSPSIQQRARMDAPECIALVMEPESRFYSDPVIVLDFQSLYPSMIIAYNYCFSTCLGKVSRLDKIGSFDFGCTSLNVPPALLEKLEKYIHVSANGAAFVKPEIRRGILPRMVEEILDTRVMVKKAMKEHKNDKVLGQLLDARQLGLKLIANVTYGYTSANFSGRMPCVEIADAIVRKARETLERAIHLVNSTEEWGARVVYGDTDSLFVLVKGATKEEAFQIGKEIVDAVTARNPKPVKLKFEKVYLPCVLLTKKRYVGYMYETLEQNEPIFDAKGIETVRRDTCPAVAKILEKSLRILFEEKDISLVKKFVQRQFEKLMEERVSPQDFIFAKEYRGMKSYKPTACVPALELARRQLSRDRRAEPRVGERVPYVVVNGTPGLPLIQLVRSPSDLLEDSTLRLNSSYYINKQILPPLSRVFSLIGVDVFTWYTELPRYVPRHHAATTGKQKTSISRFFTTLHCPVCEQLTQQGLCRSCRDNPQKAVVILATRVGNWERKYTQISEVCFQCCGTRDEKMTCVSLNCPVMFKRIKMKRNLEYGETLRDVQKRIEATHS